MQKLFAVAIAAFAVMALGTPAPAASASSAASFNACSVALDPDRKSVYSFKNASGTQLGFGRLIVQATNVYPHRYCIKFQTDGRTVTHSWSRADYPRYSGYCGSEQLGAMGSGTYQSGAYNRTLIVPDKTCVYQSYEIKYGGVWFTSRIMRYNA